MLRTLALPAAEPFGRTSYSVGLISGGVAPNVVPAAASAEVMFRIVTDADDLLAIVRTLEPAVRVEEVLRVPPVLLHTIPGIETASFPETLEPGTAARIDPPWAKRTTASDAGQIARGAVPDTVLLSSRA